MPDIEDRTERPKGVIPPSYIWVVVGLAAVAGLPFVSAFLMARLGTQQRQFHRADNIGVESGSSIQAAADALHAGRRRTAEGQPQTVTVNQPPNPPPASMVAQQGVSSAADEAHRRAEEQREEAMAPVVGEGQRGAASLPLPMSPLLPGMNLGAGFGAAEQLSQVAALMNASGRPVDGAGTIALSATSAAAPAKPAGGFIGGGKPDDFSIESGAWNTWVGEKYVIIQGTMIHTTLANEIYSDLPGPLTCIVSEPVMSYDKQHVLIPVGTKVYGETDKVELTGQSRLGIAFDMMVLPNDAKVSLPKLPAQEENGSNGLKGHVNNHTLRIFGTSLAIGLLPSTAALINVGSPLTSSGIDQLRYGFANGMTAAGTQTLARLSNIPPSITIKAGHTVEVYLLGDLQVPAYENWRINPHL
jgi:type IV secretory pathway VirB10-like protein